MRNSEKPNDTTQTTENLHQTPVKARRSRSPSCEQEQREENSPASYPEDFEDSSDKASDFSLEDAPGKKVFFKIIRNAPRDKKKAKLGLENKNKDYKDVSGASAVGKKEFLSYNRKEKSLEELSKKFLTLFIEKEESIISLDKITDHLGLNNNNKNKNNNEIFLFSFPL